MAFLRLIFDLVFFIVFWKPSENLFSLKFLLAKFEAGGKDLGHDENKIIVLAFSLFIGRYLRFDRRKTIFGHYKHRELI